MWVSSHRMERWGQILPFGSEFPKYGALKTGFVAFKVILKEKHIMIGNNAPARTYHWVKCLYDYSALQGTRNLTSSFISFCLQYKLQYSIKGFPMIFRRFATIFRRFAEYCCVMRTFPIISWRFPKFTRLPSEIWEWLQLSMQHNNFQFTRHLLNREEKSAIVGHTPFI